jgi:hypothetical protein
MAAVGQRIEIRANGFGEQAADLIHIKNGKATELHTGCDLAISDAGYILTLCETPRRYENEAGPVPWRVAD